MCINESREFEAINQKTGERKFVADTECQCQEEYHRVKKAKAKKTAILLMFFTAVILFASIVTINSLEIIGWINGTFRIVLLCLAGSLSMFKFGYLWHEIKN